jgi:hypothetical protein
VLERLAEATLKEDVETVQALAKEFHFERFCIQFCHWVWFLRCHLLCVCVCPPRTIAVFTKIGGLYYGTAVHSLTPGTGLTVADQRAFYSTLRLNGGISVVDGAPLVEYRFETLVTTANGTPAGSWLTVTPDAGNLPDHGHGLVDVVKQRRNGRRRHVLDLRLPPDAVRRISPALIFTGFRRPGTPG